MMVTIRLSLFLGVILFSLAEVSPAFEPNHQECLVPAKPRGGMEIACRLAANSLWATRLIDTPMSIDFKPGGIGAVAYNHVVGVRNNDPQLIVSASTGSAVNIAIGKFGRYDVNDVRWLAALGADYGVIAVRNDAPWHSLAELLTDLAANYDHLTIGGSGSIGSQDWIKTALLVKQVGIDPRRIHYVAFEGGGEAAEALLNGYTQIFPGDAAELHKLFAEKKVRILAVLAKERLPGLYSKIPTAKEQGYPLEWTIWRGYYMGPHVSDDAYNWWVSTLRRLVKTEEFKKERENLGLYPFELIGSEFDEFIKTRVKAFQKIATEIGLTK
ncbi:MAG: Bug family tripartite tricarboxylate transporter substrate binding protein [Desulfuromonadales bacterium]